MADTKKTQQAPNLGALFFGIFRKKPATPPKLKTAVLVRAPGRDQGTLGVLLAPGGFRCHVMELPDRDNRSNISRIPPGEYSVTWHTSPKFGQCYWVRGVPGRSAILIHPGNLAGDVAKGFKTHSWGCILLGKYRGQLNGQAAVLSSRPAVRGFTDAMNREPFTLKVMEI